MAGNRKADKTWRVIVMDNFHSYDESDDYYIDGFATKELAIEFARRFNRSSIEEFRKEGSPEEVEDAWRGFGECALVHTGEGPNITFEDELKSFFANPAGPEECDYKAVARAAGVDIEWEDDQE
jgi:hypothetical protein